MNEHDIQNEIRLHISKADLGVIFRANVGRAWTGDTILKNQDGSITIKNPRLFSTGLPEGFPDLFGVGKDARSVFIEVKRPGRKPTEKQRNFLLRMAKRGAYAGVAYSPEDAETIMRGICIGL